MKVTKLTWAGIHIQSGDSAILIDPIRSLPENAVQYLFGHAKEDFLEWPSEQQTLAVLQTHTHDDHFDPQTIMTSLGSQVPVLVPEASVEDAAKTGLSNVIGARPGDTWQFGPFQITAFHAVDGFGSPQVSWIVEAEGKKLAHSGDTLWHGFWWQMKRQYGPFDAAFLPANGALIRHPRLEASEEQACMNPEQAVAAAKLLGAKWLVPIHYQTFHNPPAYLETEHVMPRLEQAAQSRKVALQPLQTGESLNLQSEAEV